MTSGSPELFVPAITPFAEDMSVDHDRLVAHDKALMAAGARTLAPFATASEANSLSGADRVAALETLIEAGIPADALIQKRVCCAVPGTIALSAHAADPGCRGVLMLPPFYVKGVHGGGVFAAFAEVIEAVGSDRLDVYLDHIPQMAGVPISMDLIERLVTAYPGTIRGLKDKSGKWTHSRAVIGTVPDIDAYSASGSRIVDNAAAGGAGHDSASAKVTPGGIRRLIDALGTAAEAACRAQVSRLRSILEGLALIPAIKAAVARQHGDPGFARLRPPVVAPGPEHADTIARAVNIAAGRVPA